MKRKNLKPIVISALLAVGFGASTVGTSFALFTDRADTKIEVTAGIVDIESKIVLVNYSSSVEGETVTDLSEKTTHTNQLTGTSFTLDGQTVTIDKMVPGDKLTVKVTNKNRSNVDTLTRFFVSHTLIGNKKDLFPALDLKITAMKGTDEIEQPTKWAKTNAVANVENPELISEVTVVVEFKEYNEGILAREDGENNEYQDAACSINFSQQAVQGNAAISPIDEINAFMASENMQGRRNATMYNAIEDVKLLDYDVDVLENYVWSVVEDQFVLETTAGADKYNYFKICEAQSESNGFSIYAADTWATADIVLDGVGFDAGEAGSIASITYGDTGAAKSVIIRTNGGTLTIDAANDNVKHYGIASLIDIIAVASSSYVEFGAASLAKIKTGRFVLTEDAELPMMHVVETNGEFNGIKIAVVGQAELPSFSRDDVTLENGDKKLVIEVQSLTELGTVDENPEYVWISKTGDVVSSAVAASATVLDESTIVAEPTVAAERIALTADEGVDAEDLEEMIDEATRYAGGLGTEDSPYLIGSEKHMLSMKADYEYADWWEDGVNEYYYELINDITLNNYSATVTLVEKGPAAHDEYANAFMGVFNGGNHTIKYVYRDYEGQVTDVISLFGETVASYIYDLTVDCDIVTTLDVGILSSYSYYGADFENVTVKGSITTSAEMGNFSAFAYACWETKSNYHSEWINCVADVDFVWTARPLSTGYLYFGPFFAQGVGLDYAYFTGCKSTGSLTLPYNETLTALYCGAFYGRNPGYTDMKAENCEDNVNEFVLNAASEYDLSSLLKMSTGLPENPIKLA